MKVEERNAAILMRKNGYSYKEIAKEIKVSKGTISLWCRDIPLTEEHRNRLSEKSRLSSILSGRRNKERWDKIKIELLKNYLPPMDNPRFMLGLGLYWGEGTKKQISEVALSNSDIALIKNFINWIMEFFKDDFVEFSLAVHHYNKENDEQVKEYWSKELNLKLDNFNKSQFQVSKSSQKKKGNLLPYGTLHIRCKGRGVWKIRQKIEKALKMLGYEK